MDETGRSGRPAQPDRPDWSAIAKLVVVLLVVVAAGVWIGWVVVYAQEGMGR